MESRGYDPTLPLDFDGSTNLMDLPNVTLGNNPSDHDLQESRSMSPGQGLLLPMLAKTNSGRMSPVRGRTMKEYDQQITDLKKENFSLKLRIYFLEERMQQKYGDGEDVFKTNIELKVNVQSLKKELEDKQELLRKASQAINTLSSNQESDIDSVRKSLEEQHHKYTEELRSELHKALQDAEDAHDEMEASRGKMHQLEARLQDLELEQQRSHINTKKLTDDIEMKQREISALQLESDSQGRNLEDLQRMLRELEGEKDAAQHKVQQMHKDLRRRGRDVEQLSEALKDSSFIDGQSFLAPTHRQDEVDDQRDDLQRLQAKVAELEERLKDKEDMIGKLEESLKEKEKALKEANNRLLQLTTELEEEKKLGNRRDKTIQGLVAVAHKKDKEVTHVKSRLSKSETALKTARAELHEAEMANHQDQPQSLQDQLQESEDSNRRLKSQLEEANAEVETMIKSLGKKEGELAGFQEQLQQANLALTRSEEALEALQDQLEKEREFAHGRLDKQAQDNQRTIEECMHQLEGKDSLLAHMTSQLKAKDQQLTSLADLLTDENNKGQKALLQRLEDDLNQSSGTAQNALEDKQAALEQKGRELREMRQALQDKGRELEQANHQLLDRQQQLEKLEMRNRQQSEAAAQLSNALTRAQNSLEEALDRHAAALKEKDVIVARLQKAIAEKEHMIEELSNQSPSIDKQNLQLRAQLRERDQLIQELQTDCVKASCEKEQIARATQAKVQERDDEIQALSRKQRKELMNRDQEIQELSAQLGKKDLQLHSLESRLSDAEEQQREALHTMRKMLAEKDRTIEAMVDSMGEKERLLRRSQQNLTEDAKSQLAEMDSLLAENSRLKRLLREKEVSLQDEKWQKSRRENQESHHTSHLETVTHTSNADTAQVCRLLEEQIRETHALSDLLRLDHRELLVNVNSSDHHHSDAYSRDEGGSRPSAAALQKELSAVSALRQRLQEGVDKTHQLHRSLLGYTGRHTDQVTSGENSPEIDSHHLHPHYPQHSGVDQDGCPSIGSSTSTNISPSIATVRNPCDAITSVAGKPGKPKSNTLAVQTSPFLTHTLFAEGGPLSSRGSGGVDSGDNRAFAGAGEGEITRAELTLSPDASREHQRVLSRDASEDNITSAHSLLTTQLQGMSAAVLRDLVGQLQEDLITAAQQNTVLQRQLESGGLNGGAMNGSMPGETKEPSGTGDLYVQVETLKDKLKLKDEEIGQLRQHLGFPPPASAASHNFQGQVHHLRQQVKDMNKKNGALKQQVALTSEPNQHLDESYSPQHEMERLRADNQRMTAQLKTAMPVEGEGARKDVENDTLNSEEASQFWRTGALASESSQESLMFLAESHLSRNTNRYTDSALSQVPSFNQSEIMPRFASQTSQNDCDWTPRVMWSEGQSGGSKLARLAKMKLNATDSAATGMQTPVDFARKLQQSQEQVKTLEDRLVATEGTVRYMSQRLRHYRSLLQASKGDGSVSGSCLPRSQSETCLLSPQRLSLSFSCNDLREASQCSSRSMGPLGGGADLSMLSPGKMDDPRTVLGTLNLQVQALRDRYSQDLESGKQGLRQVAKQPSTEQEEDGGSNLTGLSPGDSRSREVMRREPASQCNGPEGQTGRGKVFSRDNMTGVMSEVSSYASDWPSSHKGEQTNTTPPGNRGNNTTTFHDTTLCEDVPDTTVNGNLTYNSFSESIILVGAGQGHWDSAWSSPRGLKVVRGKHAAGSQAGIEDSVSHSNRTNTTLLSNGTGEEGSPQNESDRLKSRVSVLTSMNCTLREELSIYDKLCRSMGVQVNPEGNGPGSEESSGEESCDGEMRLLQLHLAELQRLRARMEQLDTEAHNAVQVTSLLNDQHIRRITELEMTLAQLRDQLAKQQTLAQQRQVTLVQHEHVISESKILHEHQEKEMELLRENLTALQECEAQREQEQEAEVAELQQQVTALHSEVEAAQQQARELEEELEESQQRRQSYDVKFSKSQQHLQDLESQLSKAKRRVRSVEAELTNAKQTAHTLESSLSDSKRHQAELQNKYAQAEKSRFDLERELAKSMESTQSLEEAAEKNRQQNEQLARAAQAETQRCEKLEVQLKQVVQEKQQMESLASESSALQEECRQQTQRAQHYQERMAHYEQCMRDYQHRVHDCEAQVQQLQANLQSSQSKEHDSESKLRQALTHIQQLQLQVKDAEGRAHTNESIAHRADTLARTLEGRLREMEAKVRDTEDRARDSEYELRVSQSTTTEMNANMDSLKRDLDERKAKLKKRDAQLKNLVEQYKRVVSSQKEMGQLNHTLKTEIRLYESMHCQTEVSRDKKEELMKQLLSELSQTRRLAEDLITRMEHNKRNDSPSSNGGPEAADGRPSPEPRDSANLQCVTNILRVHTDSHNSTAESQASSQSEHGGERYSESPPISIPPGSDASGKSSSTDTRPKTLIGEGSNSPQGGPSRNSSSHGQTSLKGDWTQFAENEGGGRKSSEDLGHAHFRSYSHPTSLKYWRDRPNASLSMPSAGPRVEVDSDIRRLFAISGLEGYEKLKRENGELLATLSSMQARMNDRLKSFTGVSISESVEYSTLRELQMSSQNLRICAEEEGRLLSCFWLTQLPPINARGEFYDPKLADENEGLKVELRKQKSRYDLLAHTVREQQERLHATNALRKKWETTLYKQYEHFLQHQLRTPPGGGTAATIAPFVPSFRHV
ncbi:golgin subfamily A member 4-like isoform X2 [Littorina saxatilis]|uniref:golgin subfamily A member 4-like isoform X2 n=1 Tax=Littorina saxatilis TaxID=31220 RepID=UPI0038B6521C